MRERLLASSPPLTPADPSADPKQTKKKKDATITPPPPSHPTTSSPSSPPLSSSPSSDMMGMMGMGDVLIALPDPMPSSTSSTSSSSSSTIEADPVRVVSSPSAIPHASRRRRTSSASSSSSSAPSSSSSRTSRSASPSSSSSSAAAGRSRRQRVLTFSNGGGGSGGGGGGGWEAFYAHYKAQRMARRRALADDLQLEPRVAALFEPPPSYAGSDGASAVVEGRLYVGSAGAAQDPLWLQAHGITHVLNVADEIALNETVFLSAGIEYRWLNIADHCEFDIRGCFDEAFGFILAAYNTGGCVLVHCAAGVSRSATVAIAFIMHFERKQLKEALLLVREKRPYVYPNKGFFKALFDFERELFAANSLPHDALELHEDS